jgi:hypothetical protein
MFLFVSVVSRSINPQIGNNSASLDPKYSRSNEAKLITIGEFSFTLMKEELMKIRERMFFPHLMPFLQKIDGNK